jgi:hypothetical protein
MVLQKQVLEINEKGWADEGNKIEVWRKEVLEWEADPRKWMAGDTNPYRAKGKGMSSFAVYIYPYTRWIALSPAEVQKNLAERDAEIMKMSVNSITKWRYTPSAMVTMGLKLELSQYCSLFILLGGE